MWRSLSRQFMRGYRRRFGARVALSQAYRNVFSANATKSEAEMVLADLANHSGFYRVTEPGALSLEFTEGKRAVYGRIFRFLRMSQDEIEALEEAARAEAQTDSTEGEY